MTKEQIKNKIIEIETRLNGFDKLCGVGVEVKNLRLRKTKVIADVILHTDYEAGISERFNNCEYSLDKIKDINLKECCRCPQGKEIIFCGCDCHKK